MKKYFLDVLFHHYADFNGCATREEYIHWLCWRWGPMLCVCIILIILSEYALFPAIQDKVRTWGTIGLFAWILITFIPNMAITARRLHDTGHSGWSQVLFFPWPLVMEPSFEGKNNPYRKDNR